MLILTQQRFRLEFSLKLFDWALESFDYRCPDHKHNDRLGRKVAIVLPNVLWIHKKPRREYLPKHWTDRKYN